MIKKHYFESGVEGKNVLITGAVHGNEPCGAIALRNLVAKLESKEIKLKRGNLCVIPVCNPEAYAQNIRQTEENLNRAFYHNDDPQTYEQEVAQAILPYIDWADVVLDLHSFSGQGPAFALLENDDATLKDYVQHVGCEYVIPGFAELFKAKGIDNFNTTQKYAVSVGKLAMTMECGNHESPDSVITAQRVVQKLFDYLDMMDGQFYAVRDKSFPKTIRVKDVIYKTKEGSYTKKWLNFEPIAKDTVIARYDDGEELKAPFDCVMIMPGQYTKISEDWYYLGVEEQ